jgi:hypothetical protein
VERRLTCAGAGRLAGEGFMRGRACLRGKKGDDLSDGRGTSKSPPALNGTERRVSGCARRESECVAPRAPALPYLFPCAFAFRGVVVGTMTRGREGAVFGDRGF